MPGQSRKVNLEHNRIPETLRKILDD